jgi:hypothetical protein
VNDWFENLKVQEQKSRKRAKRKKKESSLLKPKVHMPHTLPKNRGNAEKIWTLPHELPFECITQIV